MSATQQYVIELSTKVQPAKKMKLDDDEHEIYGLEHLSPADEVKVSALFSRHEFAGMRLGSAGSQVEAESIAKSMRVIRHEIISTLTSIPKPTVEKLPLTLQVKLLDTLRIEMEVEADSDGDGDEEAT